MKFLQRIYDAHPLWCWFVGIILVPILALVFYGYTWINSTLPTTSGSRPIDGIKQPFTIGKDAQGTAHIKADTDHDAFFAMGYVHAQDRLWQLELQRRMASGHLSEVFGKSTLSFDIYVRTLGIYKNAEKSWQALDKASQQSLEAYAAGINAWLAGQHELPSEFAILDIQPSKWQPVDSLAWIKMFALNLASNYQDELNNVYMQRILSEDKFAAITGIDTQNTELANTKDNLDKMAQLSKVGLDMQQLWHIGGKFVGSNAWAIGPEHSQSGSAVLANDPHLGLALPSLWYAVDLTGETLKVSGMSLVGLPIVMLGKNEHIAWGATNMMADTQDLFYEQINTNNPNQYRLGDRWVDFDSHVEDISVRADFPAPMRDPLAPVQVTIRHTHNGPVISDVTGSVSQPVSLNWVGTSDKDTSYQAFLRLNYATDWDSFKQAMSLHVSPAMNLVYIDKAQNIGLHSIGKIPLRGNGNGTLPLVSALAQNSWQGYIPFEQMPQQFNPPSGIIVNANNQVVDEDYPYFISEGWAPPARAKRIEKLINSKLTEKLKLQDHQNIQLDLIDEQALRLLPQLASLSSDDPQLSEMLEVLKKWDGSTAKDSVAATVFFTWLHHLRYQLFSDDFKPQWSNNRLAGQLQTIIGEMSIDDVLSALSNNDVNWCDNTTTETIEDCAAVKLSALTQTLDTLDLLLGGDVEDWQWGEAHHTLYEHQPFSNVRGLDIVYQRKVANGGSANSINVSAGSFDPLNGFTANYGAGFRQIMSFAAKQKGADLHVYSNSTGQSGNVASTHYDDMVDPFIEGEYFDLIDAKQHIQQVLTLTPTKTTQSN